MKRIIGNGLRWIDVQHPSKEDLAELRTEFPNFHPLTLEDTLTPTQRARMDVFEDHLFVVLHFPVYDKKVDRVISSEVDIFVGKNYVITIHEGRIKALADLFDDALENPKTRREIIGKGGAGFLLYNILNTIIDSIFPILYKIDVDLDLIEDKIFEGEEISKQIEALSVQRRNVLSYRKIISPQRAVLPQIRDRLRLVGIKEQMTLYFDDLVDHIEKIWQGLDEQKEVVEGLHDDTNAVSNTMTNSVVKLLTVITVIFLPLTLIASLFGMNVKLPFAEAPFGFEILIFLMLSILVVLVLIFRKLKWL
ncbi:MAG: magnesium and cobalt transport protein CorA [Candidatus Woykebacteria bacterium RBG_16_44_10]|uniref:Magnesium transport protein CorA n=1 Tax=Candidatus Woykebacteria bacterium RBG_16_44_10 TaxID=1802597 RepID=A0A1G1WD48_9BACT|nr:MAG: magnesium and cobalt transport protein CorA [Candidatus Woykebacteria bacterium RBG_16_44_10]